MTEPARSTDIVKILRETTLRQTAAADPEATVWVSANAGTGKTHVLTMRTLRLMLAGTPPQRILCLTYTKAAAAEMSARVFDALGKWVTLDDKALAKTLGELLQRPATQDELSNARTLFAFAIETPGGLKVQTIHAFCERMLQRFPLEAGVPPGFSILDDDTVRTLQRESIDTTLRKATLRPDSDLGRALITAVAFSADDHFDQILASAIAERAFLEAATRFDLDGLESDGKARNLDELLRDTLSVRRGVSGAQIDQELVSVLSDDKLRQLADALSEGGATDKKMVPVLRAAADSQDGFVKISLLGEYFLTKKGEPKKRLMVAAVKKTHPGCDIIATRAQGRYHDLSRERLGLTCVNATLALITLAGEVLQNYTDAKARRAGLDYEDLIERTANLLASSDNADWVLYKLDGGLDHVLVDESQDTSPAQWQIIEALAKEFFTGEGARETVRTLFAVGDEKQSIYSFQGAAPEKFSAMGKRFEALAKAADQSWRRVPMNLSFRTVPPVLRAVDLVFGERSRTPGLGEDSAAMTHVAARAGRGGLVEIWPTLKPEEGEDSDVWSPFEQVRSGSAVSELADQIASTIEGWLATGERLVSEDRAIVESDILILVRKRNPFAGPMVGALKARGIAVAGADRVDLIEQIAVQDLVALGDFLVLPEDDLALACVLKSPMFGFDDDDLLALASGRRGTMWKAVLDALQQGGKFEEAAKTLLQWRKRADFLPPFEFYCDILQSGGVEGGMRARFLSRLGAEAAEPLDEFLNLMISFDESTPPSMSGFLSWLRSGKREIKRDMDQGNNEVRVMTVHGSKGLEAPIVFLPDTCTTASGGGNSSGLVTLDPSALPSAMVELMAWQIKGAGTLEAFANAGDLESDSARNERNRLLYVAMTRARDRLYVCGFENKKGRAKDCWYDIISAGLEPVASEVTDEHGRAVLRLSEAQTFATPDTPKRAFAPETSAQELPPWTERPAPAEQELAIPLAPSKLAPFRIDEDGEPALESEQGPDLELVGQAGSEIANPALPCAQPVRGKDEVDRFARGALTHALLEHLPQVAPKMWSETARAYVRERGAQLSPQIRSSVVKETLAILNLPEFGKLFGSNSRAEVDIGAEIPNPDGRGPPLRLSGTIDRIAVCDDEVMIVDYKTNRIAPSRLENIADAYLLQLAAYRLALREIYPSKTIRAAILWTQTSKLVEIPESILTQFGKELWTLARARP